MERYIPDSVIFPPKRTARLELRDQRQLLLRSATRAQCRALRTAPHNAIIISPYLTSRTAEVVIGEANPATCLVLTTFNAETFASGGSSLRTLRKLIKEGFTIRAVDGLHAKVLIAGNNVFVGSQNLTARGGTNLEATVCLIGDEPAAREIREESKSWLAESQVITLAMISDMEEAIAPLEKLAAELRERAKALDDDISSRELERIKSHRQAQVEEQRRAEELKRQTAISAAQTAHAALQRVVDGTHVRTRVLLKLSEILSYSSGETYYTLTASSRVNIAELGFGRNGEDYRLKRRMRYLLIAPEIGRLGWPALNRTRLTVFGTGLDLTEKVAIDGKLCGVSIELNQDIETLPMWNVNFRLYQRTQAIGLDIKARFTLDGFDIAEVTDDPSGFLSRQQVISLARKRSSGLTGVLQTCLLNPFKYKENSLGESANVFCSPLGDRFVLKWRLFQNHPFFTMERR